MVSGDSSDYSSDDDQITQPSRIYQKMYKKEADGIYQQRAEIEQKIAKMSDEFVSAMKDYESNPNEELKNKITELENMHEDLQSELADINEKWINTYSVFWYYKEKNGGRDSDSDSDLDSED